MKSFCVLLFKFTSIKYTSIFFVYIFYQEGLYIDIFHKTYLNCILKLCSYKIKSTLKKIMILLVDENLL